MSPAEFALEPHNYNPFDENEEPSREVKCYSEERYKAEDQQFNYPKVQTPHGGISKSCETIIPYVKFVNKVFIKHLAQSQSILGHFCKAVKNNERMKVQMCQPKWDLYERQLRMTAIVKIKKMFDGLVDEFFKVLEHDKHIPRAFKHQRIAHKVRSSCKRGFKKQVNLVNKQVCDVFNLIRTARLSPIANSPLRSAWEFATMRNVHKQLTGLEGVQSWNCYDSGPLSSDMESRQDYAQFHWNELARFPVYKSAHNDSDNNSTDDTEYTIHENNLGQVLGFLSISLATMILVEYKIQICELNTRMCRLVAHANSLNQYREMVFELRHVTRAALKLTSRLKQQRQEFSSVLKTIDSQTPVVGLNTTAYILPHVQGASAAVLETEVDNLMYSLFVDRR